MANVTTEDTAPSGADRGPATNPVDAATAAQTTPVKLLALAGLLAAAAALAVGELLGALFAPQPGPVVAVANQVVDSAPTWFVRVRQGPCSD